ncbi:jg22678 [Pararge aegeria aegeria]|uniref:Jg22678 protein n=1 Tax=Pararge aegeria aegeria TaxID=348720 RepID=A0A8S4QFB2_9NEOP|nr:jg22678 [Pararge aegeria aegeria]
MRSRLRPAQNLYNIRSRVLPVVLTPAVSQRRPSPPMSFSCLQADLHIYELPAVITVGAPAIPPRLICYLLL